MNNLEILQNGVTTLPVKDQAFAFSLLANSKRYSLSSKQMVWVDKFANQIQNPALQMEAPTVNVGDFNGVIALFQKAAQHLKHPKIRLQDNGKPIVLSVAGVRSRRPGTVNVTDGGAYGSNTWYGRVNVDGSWEASGKVDQNQMTSIAALLSNLAVEPARVAAAHGKLTGNCCFCNRGLEDARSTDVGYGPICAKHYGLTWG